ncbi:Phosphatidylserine synthase 1 [Lucilia cuprina]|nr:Phosphatidylserine synthase 1 [Lucilia cuprina]
MKKRSSSRGSPETADSSNNANSTLHAPASVKSGASSAPTTPIKTRGVNTPKPKPDEIAETFLVVNERPVDDISLDFFYKPHTITLLAVSVLAVMYFAFVRDEGNLRITFGWYIMRGLLFPNYISADISQRPLTRPHPAGWRILFGCSVLLAFKAVLIRHMGILWAISVMWELLKLHLLYLLPNSLNAGYRNSTRSSLKHSLKCPRSLWVIGRLIFICLFVAPSVRQYYTYVTDTRCKRVVPMLGIWCH